MEINWNMDKIAEGYGDTRDEFVRNMNCNSMSAQAERTVARLVDGRTVLGQEAYDVIAGNDHWSSRIEVRNMKTRLSFAPSTATGKGRFFEESTFYDKLEKVDSYVVLDMNPIYDGGKPLAYEIPAETVKGLYELEVLGSAASCAFSKRKVYRAASWRRLLRFEELFPYSTFKFEPNHAKKDYPTAKELRDDAIERIEEGLAC